MTAMILKGKNNDWEIVCGLEIHCQIISKLKPIAEKTVAIIGVKTAQNAKTV